MKKSSTARSLACLALGLQAGLSFADGPAFEMVGIDQGYRPLIGSKFSRETPGKIPFSGSCELRGIPTGNMAAGVGGIGGSSYVMLECTSTKHKVVSRILLSVSASFRGGVAVGASARLSDRLKVKGLDKKTVAQ